MPDCRSPASTLSANTSPLIAEPLRNLGKYTFADVVALRVIGGLGVAEVADLLGMTSENVRVLCHRGLTAIREELEPVDESGPAEEAVPDSFEVILSVV